MAAAPSAPFSAEAIALEPRAAGAHLDELEVWGAGLPPAPRDAQALALATRDAKLSPFENVVMVRAEGMPATLAPAGLEQGSDCVRSRLPTSVPVRQIRRAYLVYEANVQRSTVLKRSLDAAAPVGGFWLAATGHVRSIADEIDPERLTGDDSVLLCLPEDATGAVTVDGLRLLLVADDGRDLFDRETRLAWPEATDGDGATTALVRATRIEAGFDRPVVLDAAEVALSAAPAKLSTFGSFDGRAWVEQGPLALEALRTALPLAGSMAQAVEVTFAGSARTDVPAAGLAELSLAGSGIGPRLAIPYATTRNRLPEGGTLDTVTLVDGLGRVIQTKKTALVYRRGLGWSVTGQQIFDAMGRVAVQGQTFFEPGASPLYRDGMPVYPKLMSYDALGRTVQTVDPIEPTDDHPDGRAVTTMAYGFGAAGTPMTRLAATVTDPMGKVRVVYRDPADHVVAVDERNAGVVATTHYDYDPLGELLQVTDARGNPTSLLYDWLGRRTSLENLDTGTTAFQYDGAGNLTHKTDSRKVTISYFYDYDQLRRIEYPNGPAVSYDYGPPGRPRTAPDGSSGSWTTPGRRRAATGSSGSWSGPRGPSRRSARATGRRSSRRSSPSTRMAGCSGSPTRMARR